MTVLLEFESKEICTLTDKNLFTFISGKHSQHDARKCADRLNSEMEILKDTGIRADWKDITLTK